jgi:hypothetical protein
MATAALMAALVEQAINELHDDEDFQGDASQARMAAAVEEIRAGGPAAMGKYEKDAAVVHVLGKLRRFQVLAC